MRPTVRQLEYLLALSQEISFSAAAQTCAVTQSTFSAGIKELETILGQKLVIRNRGDVQLTPLGHEIVALARQSLSYIDDIVIKARQKQTPLTGRIRLGVIPTIAPYFLPRALRFLQAQFPDLHLELHEDLSERLVDQLHKRTLDCAVMAFPYDTGGLECHTLFEEEFYFAAQADQDLPAKLDIDDLQPDGLLLLEDGHCLRDHALSACKLPQPTRRKAFSATSLATLIHMVDAGYGATLLPEMVVKYGAIPESVAMTPFKSPKPTRAIGLAWHPATSIERDLLELLGALRDF